MSNLWERDGVDHINIHPRGKTRLGRLLSAESDIPVLLEPYGAFRTELGFKTWLAAFIRDNHDSIATCDEHNSELRVAKGSTVKYKGSSLPTKQSMFIRDTLFKMLKIKILKSKYLREQLSGNKHLTFLSYSVFKTDQGKMTDTNTEDEWKVNIIHDVIEQLKSSKDLSR